MGVNLGILMHQLKFLIGEHHHKVQGVPHILQQTASTSSSRSCTCCSPVPDLLGDLMGPANSAIVPVDQPAASPVMLFENNPQILLDGFMIQFNKNTFGLAAGGPLQVAQLQPGTSARARLPMVLFQNMSAGPPSSLLQVAVKNSQQPAWYFNDKILLHVFFTEDGRMERGSFLETWRSLPDSNEVLKDLTGIVVSNLGTTLDRLAASNMFFIAKRKNANQDVFYFSAKIPRGIPFLFELTTVLGNLGVKCVDKTPNPDKTPLFIEAIETLLKA